MIANKELLFPIQDWEVATLTKC